MLYPIETIFSYINTLQSSQLSQYCFTTISKTILIHYNTYHFTQLTQFKSILSNKSTTSNTQTLQFYTIHNLQFTALPYTTITPKTYRTNTHSFNPIHSHYPQYLNILQTPITNHNTSNKLQSTQINHINAIFITSIPSYTHCTYIPTNTQISIPIIHSLSITQSTHTILTNNHFIQQFIFNTSHIHNLIQRLRTNH